MSAHVLLNLLNELRKRDKMRGLPRILSLFRNEFNKFNNTILGNPGVTHSVPTAFINDECSGYGMGHAWVTEIDECSGYGMGHAWVTEDE